MFDKLDRLSMKLKPHIVPAALVFSTPRWYNCRIRAIQETISQFLSLLEELCLVQLLGLQYFDKKIETRKFDIKYKKILFRTSTLINQI